MNNKSSDSATRPQGQYWSQPAQKIHTKHEHRGEPTSAKTELELVRMLAKLSPDLSLADLADFPNWRSEEPDSDAPEVGGDR